MEDYSHRIVRFVVRFVLPLGTNYLNYRFTFGYYTCFYTTLFVTYLYTKDLYLHGVVVLYTFGLLRLLQHI